MKINFVNKDGENVMQVDSSKEKDVIVLDESLSDLKKEDKVSYEAKEEDDEETED